MKRLFLKILKIFKHKDSFLEVVIGSKTCKVAPPTALRYHKLMQLLELPDGDKILKLQTELEQKLKDFAKLQSDDLRAQIVELNKAIQSELLKHSQQIQSAFQNADYARLKEIVNTVCENEVSEDDIKNCFEAQVAIAVDFFLAMRIKISNSISESYTTYAKKNQLL